MAIDMDELKKLIETGADAEQLKEHFGVKQKTSIQNAVARLMVAKGQVYNVPGLFHVKGSGGRGMSKTLTNGKQGLRLSPQRMLSLGFDGSEKFIPEKHDQGVLLRKV